MKYFFTLPYVKNLLRYNNFKSLILAANLEQDVGPNCQETWWGTYKMIDYGKDEGRSFIKIQKGFEQ